MNHKHHPSKSSKHSLVEINIIISLTMYSSITELNPKNSEMMGLFFFNKTFFYLHSIGACDFPFFTQRVERRTQKKIPIMGSKHSKTDTLGTQSSVETTEVREGMARLSYFSLQKNGAFRISLLLVGLLSIHRGPHTALKISSANT